jgi:hypothetical protein
LRSRAPHNGFGLAAALLGLALGCKTDRANQGVPSGGGPMYEPAPSRQVVGEGGPVGSAATDGPVGMGGSGGIGVGGAKQDGGRRDGSTRLDAPAPEPPSQDASSGSCQACDLLRQDCAGQQACYPQGGGTCCAEVGLAPEGGPCAEDRGCGLRLICVDFVCVPLCDTAAPLCAACRPLVRYQGVGYCVP